MGEKRPRLYTRKNFLEDVLKQKYRSGRKSYFCGAEFVERDFLVKGKEILYNRNRISFRAQPHAQT